MEEASLKKFDLSEGLELLSQGKRNLFCGEIKSALDQLAKAVSFLVSSYGQLSIECAEPYYLYGSALLEDYRNESCVLGDKIEQVKEGDSIDNEENKSSDEDKGDSDDAPEDGDPPDVNGFNKVNKDELEASGSQEETEDGEEEVSTLQLSWELFELAKLIYSKESSSENKVKLADTYFKLGEVAMESENFTGALEDYENCLRIQKECLPEDSRLIAQTFYQTGITFSLIGNYKMTQNYLMEAMNVLKMKMKNLEGKSKERKELEKKENDEIEKETNEIKSLVQEINLKIIEIVEEEKNSEKLKKMVSESISPSKSLWKEEASSSQANSQGVKLNMEEKMTSNFDPNKINNINHLVRKKKTSEEQQIQNKKQKTNIQE